MPVSALAASGRPVPPSDYHLTLAFLGAVPTDLLGEVRAAATEVRMPVIHLDLDQFGVFPRAGILWLGPGHAPVELTELVAATWQRLAPLGIREPDAFRAHITLARQVHRAPPLPAPPPVHWVARDFVLVESLAGQQALPPGSSRYRVLERFPAAGSPNGPEAS